MKTPPADRFWRYVDLTPDCWLWTGAKANGYGYLTIANKQVLVHRFAYELLVGPIPQGLTLDHLCRVRNCVNPAHLEPVTNRENILRGTSMSARWAQRTHCSKGHPLEQGPRGRRCLICCNAWSREAKRRARARAKDD